MKWFSLPILIIAAAGLLWAGYHLAESQRDGPARAESALIVNQLAARRILIVGQAVVEARLHLKVPATRLMGVSLPDDAELLRLVPATVSYGVDLSGLKASALESGSKTTRLTVPDVKIIAIDPMASGVFESKSLGLLRSEAAMGNALERQAAALTRPAIEKRASDPALMAFARAQAKVQIAALVAQLGGPADVEIRIQPGN